MESTLAILLVVCLFECSNYMFATQPFRLGSKPPSGEGENGDSSKNNRRLPIIEKVDLVLGLI